MAIPTDNLTGEVAASTAKFHNANITNLQVETLNGFPADSFVFDRDIPMSFINDATPTATTRFTLTLEFQKKDDIVRLGLRPFNTFGSIAAVDSDHSNLSNNVVPETSLVPEGFRPTDQRGDSLVAASFPIQLYFTNNAGQGYLGQSNALPQQASLVLYNTGQVGIVGTVFSFQTNAVTGSFPTVQTQSGVGATRYICSPYYQNLGTYNAGIPE